MQIKNNYKSIISLGAFNPSILTPEFLNANCNFKSAYKPEGRTTPVISELIFGNIRFLMELEKFQVVEIEPVDFESKKLLELILRYLNILRYTPIARLGTNFNYLLTDIRSNIIADLISKPEGIEKLLNAVLLDYKQHFQLSSDNRLNLIDVSILYGIESGIKNSININFLPEGLVINNNFEINGLDKDRNRLQIMEEKYAKLIEINKLFISKLEAL